MFPEAATHKKNISCAFSFKSTLCEEPFNGYEDIFDGWSKNPTVLHECHHAKHNSYRNRQISRAVLLVCHNTLIIDHKTYNLSLANIFLSQFTVAPCL